MQEAIRPLGGHAVFLLLIQLAVLLFAARVGAELCKRVSLPAVLGELAAGIVLGPSGLGHFAPDLFLAIFPPISAQHHLLEVVGTMGMVLLLLLTGLETDLRLLRNLGRAALIASAMGMLVPFLSGFGLGLFMPERFLAEPDRRVLFSFFLATAMAISAMPVIAKILMDLDLTKRNIGLVILSAGVVDDTAGWLILSVIAGSASHGGVPLAGLLRTLLLTGAFVVAAVVLVYPASRWLMGMAKRRLKSADADLVLLLIVTFLCAAATEWAGIHAVFGAFVAGTLFRQVPLLDSQTVRRLESFVLSVLAPVFFGTVGLKVDLWNLGGGTMLGVVLAVACLGKLVGCTVGSMWGGLRFWEGLSIAVAMNARGAMELVVATIGLSLGILNQQMFSIIVVVAIVTSFMAPLGLRLTMRKVRMTEDEARRILAAQSQGVFDPARVRVLVPTAGGPNELGAFLLAGGLAKRSAHPVEVMSVHEPISFADRLRRLLAGRRPGESGSDRLTGTQRQLIEAGLPPVVQDIKRPDVADAIVEQAKRGFDFIVMGASRHGSWLGGPVVEEVVHAAPCHVAIVKVGRGEPRYRRVLALFDGGVFSSVGVEFAARYGEVTDAELTVAVLTERGGERGPDVPAVPPPDDGMLDRISPVFRAMDRKPRIIHVEATASSSRFADEAESGHYDLVVIGTENRAVQHRLFFGRDNEALIRSSTVTLAFVVPNVTMLRSRTDH